MVKYRGIYREVYILHEKYSGKLTDTDWENLCAEASVLAKKYGNTEFVIDFLLSVIEEIERVSKI